MLIYQALTSSSPLFLVSSWTITLLEVFVSWVDGVFTFEIESVILNFLINDHIFITVLFSDQHFKCLSLFDLFFWHTSLLLLFCQFCFVGLLFIPLSVLCFFLVLFEWTHLLQLLLLFLLFVEEVFSDVGVEARGEGNVDIFFLFEVSGLFDLVKLFRIKLVRVDGIPIDVL